MGQSKLEYYCVVPECENSLRGIKNFCKLQKENAIKSKIPRNKVRGYFLFPRNPETCKKWLMVVNPKKQDLEHSYSNWRVCENHFKKSDFIVKQKNKVKTLKPNSIPSLKLKNISKTSKSDFASIGIQNAITLILNDVKNKYPTEYKNDEIHIEYIANDKQIIYDENNYCKIAHCKLNEFDGVELFELPKENSYGKFTCTDESGEIREVQRRQAWLGLIGIDENNEKFKSSPLKICSQHFKPDNCRIRYLSRGVSVVLLKSAIPSEDLVAPHKQAANKSRQSTPEYELTVEDLNLSFEKNAKKRKLKMLPLDLENEDIEMFDDNEPLPEIPVICKLESSDDAEYHIMIGNEKLGLPTCDTGDEVKVEEERVTFSLQNLCRVCANEEANLLKIFSDEGCAIRCQRLMDKFLDIKVVEGEVEMPQSVCSSCLHLLQQSDKLALTAQTANTQLRSKLAEWHAEQKFQLELQQALALSRQNEDDMDSNSNNCDNTQQSEDEQSEYISDNEARQEGWVFAEREDVSAPIFRSRPRKHPRKHPHHHQWYPSLEDNNPNQTHNSGSELCTKEKNNPNDNNLKVTINNTKVVVQASPYVTPKPRKRSKGVAIKHRVHLTLKFFRNIPNYPENHIFKCEYCDYSTKILEQLEVHLVKHGKDMCNFCCELFDNENELQEHKVDKHYRECRFCKQKFHTQYYFNTHLKRVHNAVPKYIKMPQAVNNHFSCKMCSEKPKFTRTLKHHYFWQHLIYACDICFQLFENSEEQIKHTDEVHMIPCPYCNIKNYTYHRFKRHLNTHKSKSTQKIEIPKSSGQIYECEYCNKGLSSKENLKRHHHWCHFKYTCIICLTTFPNAQLEEEHFLTHGNVCTYCEIRFDTESELLAHEKSHPNFRSKLCETCGDRFTTKDELNLHKESHDLKPTHLCDLCGKYYKTRTALDTHRYSHNKDKVQCHICNRTFLFISQLKSHMITHTKEKNYKCIDCNLDFLNAKQLNEHMSLHKINCTQNNIKKIPCHLCNVQFTSMEMKSHLKESHSSSCIYKCNVCNEIFVQECDIKLHVSFHNTMELAYANEDKFYVKLFAFSCDFCQQYFVDKQLLAAHVATHFQN